MALIDTTRASYRQTVDEDAVAPPPPNRRRFADPVLIEEAR
jgi:hypothetical protein